jgi:hypothetical protein
MTMIGKGIAHVSFTGGGMFLPARDPYNRETLVAHVVHLVSTREHVQVIVDERRWMVHLSRSQTGPCCSSCGAVVHSVCYAVTGGDVYCVKCAFGGQVETVLGDNQPPLKVRPLPDSRPTRSGLFRATTRALSAV